MFLINYLQIWIWSEASLGNFEWCNYTQAEVNLTVSDGFIQAQGLRT